MVISNGTFDVWIVTPKICQDRRAFWLAYIFHAWVAKHHQLAVAHLKVRATYIEKSQDATSGEIVTTKMMATSVQILRVDMNSGLSNMKIWRSPLDTKKQGQFIRDICYQLVTMSEFCHYDLPKSYAWGLALGKIPSNLYRNLRWILDMMVWKRCFLRNSLSGCNNVAISRRYPWHHCCGSIRVTWRKTERVNLAKHEVQMFKWHEL